TVFVALGAVAGEVAPGKSLEVRIDEALVIAEHRTHLAGPAVGDHEIAFGNALERLAFAIDDRGLHAEKRQRGRAWLLVDRTGQRTDEDAAGLRLPPRVDHRAAAVADDAVIPLPRFRIDRLADRAEQPQRTTRPALHRRIAFAHQRADRGGRGVEDRHLVLVDGLPEAAGVGIVRHALEHQRRCAVRERPVHDVAVAGDPADV